MRINGIVWLRDVIEKIRLKHHVSIFEVEEVFARGPHFKFVERGKYEGEDVYAAFGRTSAGRYLVIFFIHKDTGEALILSARDMDKKERKQYDKVKR